MNRVIIAVVLTLLMPPQPSLSAVEATKEAALEQTVEKFGQAFLEADQQRLDELLTEDYLHVNGKSGNVLDRTQWLRWIETRKKQLESGDLVVEVYRIEDLSLVLYGETAVVTGLVVSSGVQSGAEFSSRIRFTNTWIVQDGQWRRASFHDSPAPRAEPSEE